MTQNQFRAAISKLGLSQRRAGVFFGYSPRQGQRWAAGESPVPTAVAYCIQFMLMAATFPPDLSEAFQDAIR